MSTRYIGHRAFAHLSPHSLYWTWNVPGRYVVGGCATCTCTFPHVQKGIVLHAIPFDNDWSKETQKRSGSILWSKSGLNGSWPETSYVSNTSRKTTSYVDSDLLMKWVAIQSSQDLKWDDIGVNVVSTAMLKRWPQVQLEISTSAKYCREQAVQL